MACSMRLHHGVNVCFDVGQEKLLGRSRKLRSCRGYADKHVRDAEDSCYVLKLELPSFDVL